MGGMISQTMAILHPSRILSLTSIMSTTGQLNLADGDLSITLKLLKKPANTEEARITNSVAVLTAISRPCPPGTDLKQYVTDSIRRSFHPVGAGRQINAILAQEDRRDKLKLLTMPCAVIHGRDDRLVKLEHGLATKAAIDAGSTNEDNKCNLVVVDGMAHYLNREFYGVITGAILENVNRVKGWKSDREEAAVGVEDVGVKLE